MAADHPPRETELHDAEDLLATSAALSPEAGTEPRCRGCDQGDPYQGSRFCAKCISTGRRSTAEVRQLKAERDHEMLQRLTAEAERRELAEQLRFTQGQLFRVTASAINSPPSSNEWIGRLVNALFFVARRRTSLPDGRDFASPATNTVLVCRSVCRTLAPEFWPVIPDPYRWGGPTDGAYVPIWT